MLKEIAERRSCKRFNPNKPVSKEDIDKIIQAGLLAPSGMNKQSGIVIAITNKEIRDKLAKLNKGNWDIPDPFYGAPVILLVAAKKGFLAQVDGACMIENMLLEAVHLGLGGCWVHRAKEELESEEGRALLASTGLDLTEYEGVGHCIIGYSDGFEPAPKEIREGRKFYIE